MPIYTYSSLLIQFDTKSSRNSYPTGLSCNGQQISLTHLVSAQTKCPSYCGLSLTVSFLGLYQLCLGRISALWAQTGHRYDPSIDAEYWNSLIIQVFWSFIRAMWSHRNSIMPSSLIVLFCKKSIYNILFDNRTQILGTKVNEKKDWCALVV